MRRAVTARAQVCASRPRAPSVPPFRPDTGSRGRRRSPPAAPGGGTHPCVVAVGHRGHLFEPYGRGPILPVVEEAREPRSPATDRAADRSEVRNGAAALVGEGPPVRELQLPAPVPRTPVVQAAVHARA